MRTVNLLRSSIENRPLGKIGGHKSATSLWQAVAQGIIGEGGYVSEAAQTPLRLTICGLEELAGHCEAPGVTHVLSILDPGWPDPEPIRNFDLNRRLKLNFHDVIEPMPGWIPPERWDVELLLAFGRDLGETAHQAAEESGEAHLLVHCHAGVSRSTASAILLLAQYDPARPARGRRRSGGPVAAARVAQSSHDRNGRRGCSAATVRSVSSVSMLYRLALDREPGLAEAMKSAGRGREVAAAGL